jgi:hypothetical protein
MPIPAATAVDRRHNPRYQGKGLMAHIGDKLVEVMDVSVDAVRLSNGFGAAAGAKVSLTLIPREGERLDLNKGVKASGTVIRVDGDAVVVAFSATSWALSKLVVWLAGQKLGVTPHLVK